MTGSQGHRDAVLLTHVMKQEPVPVVRKVSDSFDSAKEKVKSVFNMIF